MFQPNKSITIVTYQYSIVVKGIEKNLKDEGYEVTTISHTSDQVEDYARLSDLIIVYLPEDFLSDKEGVLSFEGIHEVLEELGKEMIVIGEKRIHEDFLKAIPSLSKDFWMDRPIDKDVLIRLVSKVTEGDKEEGIEQEEPKKILIVDDDPSYAKIIREWLKDLHQVYVLTAGKLVEKFLEKNQIDIILLDYEMPGMDGPEVMQLIRSNPETADIPIVFLTGVNTKESIVRVMSLKPAGYILKSTTRDGLLEKLRKLF